MRQAKDRWSTGPSRKDHNLVFASAVGTQLEDHNVRRQFQVTTELTRGAEIMDEIFR